jgi:hypothetical protein
LERADLADALGVLGCVPRDASLPLGRGKQTARLVVADGVDRDITRGGELLDPIPHDR